LISCAIDAAISPIVVRRDAGKLGLRRGVASLVRDLPLAGRRKFLEHVVEGRREPADLVAAVEIEAQRIVLGISNLVGQRFELTKRSHNLTIGHRGKE
jgi:hypothetical protein